MPTESVQEGGELTSVWPSSRPAFWYDWATMSGSDTVYPPLLSQVIEVFI